MMNDSEFSALFAAFAHPSRVAILRLLLPHGFHGKNFGEVGRDLDISPSTLKHHIREMEDAGVVVRKVTGRTTNLRVNLSALASAVDQLTELCCSADHQDTENPEDSEM